MNRKVGIIFFLTILIVLISSNSLYADVKNVKDCLEDEADCEEISDDQGTPQMDSNDNLIGEEKVERPSIIFNIIKMIFALLLVLALIYLILMFVKKRNRLFSDLNILESLGGITVGQNKSIQIIRIGSKIYLIGVGDNVEMLQEVTDDEVIETLLTVEQSEQQPFLETFLQKRKSKKHDNDDFTSTLEEELNKLKHERNEVIHKYNEKDDRHG